MGRNAQGSRKSPAAVRQLEADTAALDLRRQGLTYPAIAAALDCSTSTAYARVCRSIEVARRERAETAEAVIQIELDRLDAMLSAIWDEATAGEVSAIDRCLRISERRMKILGLERAKLEMSGPDGGPVAVDASAYERIRAKLAKYRAAATD